MLKVILKPNHFELTPLSCSQENHENYIAH